LYANITDLNLIVRPRPFSLIDLKGLKDILPELLQIFMELYREFF
jgi:hypothetical protein